MSTLTLVSLALAGAILAWGGRGQVLVNNLEPRTPTVSAGSNLSALKRGKLALAALIVVTLLDLSSHTWGYGWGSPTQVNFSPTPVVSTLRRLVDEAGQPLRVSSEGLLPDDGNGAILAQLEDFDGNSPVELTSFVGFSRQVSETRALRLLNVGYIATRRTLPEGDVALVETVGNAHIYRLLGALPRAYVVYHAQSAESQTAAWAAANRRDYNPAGETIVEGQPLVALAAPTAPPTVEYLKRAPGVWQLRVRSAAAGLLVVSEVAEPGWQAGVDGQRVAWLRADGVRMAVSVPAGEHVVDLAYEPLEAVSGLIVSGLTVIGLALFWIIGANVKREA